MPHALPRASIPFRLTACAVAVLVVAGCSSSGGDPDEVAEAGTPAAYCPVIVDLVVESHLAGATVGDDGGPDVVAGPAFAGVREELGRLVELGPERIRELAADASFDPASGETADPVATRAFYGALSQLPASCLADLEPASCRDDVAALLDTPDRAALDEIDLAALGEECAGAVPLTGLDPACRALGTALLIGEAEAPHLVDRYVNRC